MPGSDDLLRKAVTRAGWDAERQRTILLEFLDAAAGVQPSLMIQFAEYLKLRVEQTLCDHVNNQCCGDFVRCNDCGETWSVDDED